MTKVENLALIVIETFPATLRSNMQSKEEDEKEMGREMKKIKINFMHVTGDGRMVRR